MINIARPVVIMSVSGVKEISKSNAAIIVAVEDMMFATGFCARFLRIRKLSKVRIMAT